MTEITVTPADEAAAKSFAEARKMGGLGDGISLAERFARHSHEARKAGMLEAAAIADRDRRAFEERAKNQNLTRNERTRCSHYVQALTEQAIAIRSVVGGEDSHNA